MINKQEQIELALELLAMHLDSKAGIVDRAPYNIWEAFVFFWGQIQKGEPSNAE